MSTETKSTYTSTLAIISFVSGISAWLFLPILGALIAVITGHLAKKEINEHSQIDGEGFATAGLILGYVHLALSLLAVILSLVIILIAAGILFVSVSGAG